MRLKYILLILLIFITAQTFAADADADIAAVTALANRVVPSIASKLRFEKTATADGKDVFELESVNDKTVIRGNSANAMAVGLNHYLKYYCLTSISWHKYDKPMLPATLPIVQQKVRREARVQNRFFLNYCTFGYTMPWWQWRDWEWFIDWMALNGINMPLAITGQEAIWYNVWKQFGLNDAQIRSYFTGPAFLPWHRMANLDHWGGPLPKSWLNSQLELQKKIVSRERSLGMKPVLPAFAGHVPELIKTKYPQAKITGLGEWSEFSKKYQSYFLDPFDPLFNKIQKAFLTEQTRLFGTDHIYGTDPFNEVTPPSWEPEYLASVSKTIYSSMQANDPQAQWLQMSWIFFFQRENWTNPRIEAFLKAVPQDKMMLLDYYCDNTEVWKITDKFFGQPYLWCYLGNFGSNEMLVGNLKEVESRMEDAFNNGGKNMWGVGSTLEGFGVNPVMYEYVFDKVWADGAVNTDEWLKSWANNRRGSISGAAQKAWDILGNKIYVAYGHLGQGTLTNARPSLTGHGEWPTDPKNKYDNKDLLNAWQTMLQADGGVSPDVFKYDVVNIGRQVLGNYFEKVRNKFTVAYSERDIIKLNQYGHEMEAIINDMDDLLGTDRSFLLGKWINDARALGVNPAEKNYYEHNARTVLTTWGEQGSVLTDYANRNWNGLMRDYYGKRWHMFITDVTNAARTNTKFDEKAFEQKSFAFEWKCTLQHNKYGAVPKGNALELSRRLLAKYSAAVLAN